MELEQLCGNRLPGWLNKKRIHPELQEPVEKEVLRIAAELIKRWRPSGMTAIHCR